MTLKIGVTNNEPLIDRIPDDISKNRPIDIKKGRLFNGYAQNKI